ncbi:MAG: hypothetical protein ACLP3B_08260, partial [Syntrophobacteraceae bacterium]
YCRPVARLPVAVHAPAEPAGGFTLGGSASAENIQMTEMQMNRPGKYFERFTLRISDHSPSCYGQQDIAF